MKTITRKTLTSGLAILMAAALFCSAPAAGAAEGWGVGPPKDGQPPVGNMTLEQLAQYDAVYRGDTDQKVIYLTFDAGYEDGHMPKILDTLKKHQASAAFFIVGHYIKANPELTKRMCEEGHIVGNHTDRHPDMSQISDLNAFRKELESLEALYREATGREMSRYYRPPEGKYSETNLKLAKQLGYKTVFWSVAYVDWVKNNQPGHQQALDKLMSRTHPGAVILLHSTSKTNAEILDQLLTKWKAGGYRFGTLEELYSE